MPIDRHNAGPTADSATASRPFVFHAADGAPLAGAWHGAPGGTGRLVLVAGALATPQRFYSAFAQWLAARGHRVLTFDPRGIGASRALLPGASLRGLRIDMLGWARQDFAAAVREAARQAPADGEPPVTLVGHSLGVHHAAMTDAATQAQLRHVVSVAAGAG